MTNNQDIKITNFYSLRPLDFPNLVRLSVYQEISLPGETPVINVEIELSRKKQSDPQHLFLDFKGVTNFNFTQPSSSLVQIIQIEIRAIEDWQWENVRYKVIEVEDNVFILMCKEFDAILK
jgi:hypothetical protein